MTTEHIIKGLECCVTEARCTECPYHGCGCIDRLHSEALTVFRGIEWLTRRVDKLHELYRNEGTLFGYSADYDDGFWRGVNYVLGDLIHPEFLPQEAPTDD